MKIFRIMPSRFKYEVNNCKMDTFIALYLHSNQISPAVLIYLSPFFFVQILCSYRLLQLLYSKNFEFVGLYFYYKKLFNKLKTSQIMRTRGISGEVVAIL